MRVKCPQCRRWTDKPTGAVNRAHSIGAPIYCDKACAGRARRKHKTRTQKRWEKKLYDQRYRARNLKRILARKHEYHQRTYDPKKAAVVRKKRMPLHVEYCRQPKYKAYKRRYDSEYSQRPIRREKSILRHYTGPLNPKDEKQWLSRNKATVRNLRRLCKNGSLYPEALSSLIVRYGLAQISLT